MKRFPKFNANFMTLTKPNYFIKKRKHFYRGFTAKNLDSDRDGVPDYKDCQPLNPNKHILGMSGEIIDTMPEGGYGAGHMAPLQTADLMGGLELVLRGKDKGKIRKKRRR